LWCGGLFCLYLMQEDGGEEGGILRSVGVEAGERGSGTSFLGGGSGVGDRWDWRYAVRYCVLVRYVAVIVCFKIPEVLRFWRGFGIEARVLAARVGTKGLEGGGR
jgi:hypothetical protein